MFGGVLCAAVWTAPLLHAADLGAAWALKKQKICADSEFVVTTGRIRCCLSPDTQGVPKSRLHHTVVTCDPEVVGELLARQDDFPKLWGRQKAEKSLQGFAGDLDAWGYAGGSEWVGAC